MARIAAPGTSCLMHVRMLVFRTVFVFMDENPGNGGGRKRATLHFYVADSQPLWCHAVKAGALPVIPLARQFWGELYGRLKDPFGLEWTIAQTLESAEVEDVARAHLTPQEQ